MNDKKLKQEFIEACTITFEAFNYSCTVPKAIGSLWEMVATKFNGDKSYAIVCTSRVDSIRNNIRIAQKKLGEDTRLIVVVEEVCPKEINASLENDYALISVREIKQFGIEMATIIERDRMAGREVSEEELDALSSSREKIF